MILKLLLPAMILLLGTNVMAQQKYSISGKIQTTHNKPVAFASIELKEHRLVTNADELGQFAFDNLDNRSFTLIISAVGYKTVLLPVSFSKPSLTINITLDDSNTVLNEVTVSARSENLHNKAYRPDVINMRLYQASPTPVLDLMNRIPGLRIRQQGGMGSTSDIMVNGVSGKGIAMFLDDIPMNLTGSGLAINNIASSIIDHVEIYKGVVPVQLSADALGGAINIKTVNTSNDYLNLSYSYGSWNTHQTSISARNNFGKKIPQYIMLDGFYNHSDNNYFMYDVDVKADHIGNTKKGKARRFHDNYTSSTGRLRYGIQHLTWADELNFTVAISKINRQLQHGITAINPWGQVTGNHEEVNAAVLYKKTSLNNKWKTSVFAGYNYLKNQFTDTTARTYLWDGSSYPKSTKGESGLYTNGLSPIININNAFIRLSLDYAVNPFHKINFTSLTSIESVRGEDKAGAAVYQQDYYQSPQSMRKVFSGVSLESKFWNGRITNIAGLKYHYSRSHVATFKSDGSFEQYTENKQHIPGFNEVLKYKFSPALSLYAGYEYASRLPDKEEIFGDGLTVATNGKLTAENSHNINIGIQWEDHKIWTASIAGFIRNTKNQIFLNALSTGMSAYTNLLGTQSKGIEAAVTLHPVPALSISANATYQRILLKKPDKYGIIEPRFAGARLPNIPFLFANGAISYSLEKKTPSFPLTITYNTSFVNKFYVAWEQDGIASTKSNVPTQIVHSAIITYTAQNKRYSIAFECRNITNERTYDKYMVQKPGTGFFTKIRYALYK